MKMKNAKNKKNLKSKEAFFVSFSDAKNYLKESRNYIYFLIGVFTLFTLIGFFAPVPEEISSQLLNYFENLVNKTKDFGPIEMIGYLFQNNFFASLLGLVGGIFFGVFPLINGIMNGFVLGFAANWSVANNGLFSLWRLLPHGIFELPALFISLGLGLRLGGKFFEKYFKVKGEIKQSFLILGITLPLLILFGLVLSYSSEIISLLVFVLIVLLSFYFLKDETLRREFKFSINVFIFVVLPLLAIAAVIEGLLITL